MFTTNLRFMVFLLLAFLWRGEAMGAGAPKVLLLGDSLTEGQGVPEDATYVADMERELKIMGRTDVVLRNAGIGGSTSASGLSRLRWHLKETPRPTILVLALGPNDGLRGLSTDVMKANLRAVIRLAIQNNMKVLLAGMKMPPNYGKDYTRRFETVFKDLAREEHVPLIPFLLDGVAANPKLNLQDGIHPNEEGCKIVAATVFKHLLPLLGKKQTKGPEK